MSKENDGKVFAFLGAFLTWIGFIIVLLTKKNNKYAMYYAKQGLVLGVAWVALWIIGMVPLIGRLAIVGIIVLIVLWFIAWIHALSGEQKPLPLLQKFADMINV